MTAPLPLVVFVDSFPELSETFVLNEIRALRELGWEVRVEATRQAALAIHTRDLPDVDYLPDGGGWGALALLAARHPLRVARDLALRRRWRRDEEIHPLRSLAQVARRLAEPHMHVHFAATACLDAMRIGLLTGVPYSVTTHAYDIFKEPRNLDEKLRRAAFTATVCDYNNEHLPRRGHKIVMGVDPGHFRRARPYPGTREVLAVGRLVEKKGFRHLAQAAAQLRDVRVRIVGEGPLRAELEDAAVELLGAREPDEVRALLETVDLLVAPSVVAADGDRDSMPVVVKEALAMEVPVVASDAVGLPEVVGPDWGRLVPPGDPDALARAIEDVLALPVEARVAMGRAGRAWVSEHCNVKTETAKLAALIEESLAR